MKVLVLALVMLPGQCLASEIDFKGLPFGTSKAEFQQAYPASASLCFNRDEIDANCCYLGTSFEMPTYADILPTSATACFIADKLESVEMSFYAGVFPAIVQAMAAKYGKPNSAADVVQNAFGAKFERTTKKWHAKHSTAYAIDHYPALDRATVMLMSSTYRAALRKPKPASKDL